MSVLAVEGPPALALMGPDGLTPAEQNQADQLEKQASLASTLAEIALTVGGAFLLYRAYAIRRISISLPPTPESSTLRLLARASWMSFQPTWLKITVPAVAAAYAKGMIDAKHGRVPPELLQLFAEQYARDIGNYFNETSSVALDEGFNAYVNKKLPKRIAASRVLKAYGLSERQMRAVVAAEQMGALKVFSPIEHDHDGTTNRYIETQLVRRAQQIGDNEAFTAFRRGKHLTWLYLSKHGVLPISAKRVWVTAHDEKVCKYCGPLHGKKARLDQPFKTAMGPVWVPALHPNCRCDITLEIPTRELFGLVTKADWWREELHPRNAEGEFTFKPRQPISMTALATVEETREEAKPAGYATVGVETGVGGGFAQVGAGEATTGYAPVTETTTAPAGFATIGAEEPSHATVTDYAPITDYATVVEEAVRDQVEVSAEIEAQEQALEQVVTEVAGATQINLEAPLYYVLSGAGDKMLRGGTPVAIGQEVELYPDDVMVQGDRKDNVVISRVLDKLRETTETIALREGFEDDLRAKAHIENTGYAEVLTRWLPGFRTPGATQQELQRMGQAYGFHREDFRQDIYVVDNLTLDPSDPASIPQQDQFGNWKAPGTYVITGFEEPEDAAFPQRYVYLEYKREG